MRERWAFSRIELVVYSVLVIRRDIHNHLCVAEGRLYPIIELLCESDFLSGYDSI